MYTERLGSVWYRNSYGYWWSGLVYSSYQSYRLSTIGASDAAGVMPTGGATGRGYGVSIHAQQKVAPKGYF